MWAERLIKSSVFWPHAAPALYWNVNWFDWSGSQITHKATCNKDQDPSQSRPAEPWERERCECLSVCGAVCSLLLPHILLSDNKQNQNVRRFMGKLKAHVLLRLEQRGLWSYANDEAFWCYKSNHYLKQRPSFLFSPSFFSSFHTPKKYALACSNALAVLGADGSADMWLPMPTCSP